MLVSTVEDESRAARLARPPAPLTTEEHLTASAARLACLRGLLEDPALRGLSPARKRQACDLAAARAVRAQRCAAANCPELVP